MQGQQHEPKREIKWKKDKWFYAPTSGYVPSSLAFRKSLLRVLSINFQQKITIAGLIN
jgi:hypothetical protein